MSPPRIQASRRKHLVPQAKDSFERGRRQFNSGAFFQAHETWEEIWLMAAEPEKTFLQGIIQVAAAFHHFQRGNLSGTRSLLTAGSRKLKGFPDDYRGVDAGRLRRAVARWMRKFAVGDSVGRLPRIELARRGRPARSVRPRPPGTA